MSKRTKKTLSVDAAVLRLGKYCAYTERTLDEVNKKLEELEVGEVDAKIVVERLTKQGFINEKRFAESFARGKFRIKKWGKRRIKMEMRKKGLSDELIEKGLEELPEEDYSTTLDELLQKKWKQLQRSIVKDKTKDVNAYNSQKLIRYALQKGYEMDLVMDRIKALKVA
jgi:regulatory protein